MDEGEKRMMEQELSAGRAYTRQDMDADVTVFYTICPNTSGKRCAKWEIGVQLGEGDRIELTRLKNFGTFGEAVNYLITNKAEPLKYHDLLSDARIETD